MNALYFDGTAILRIAGAATIISPEEVQRCRDIGIEFTQGYTTPHARSGSTVHAKLKRVNPNFRRSKPCKPCKP